MMKKMRRLGVGVCERARERETRAVVARRGGRGDCCGGHEELRKRSFGKQQPHCHHHHLHYNTNHRRNPETLPRLHPGHDSPGAARRPHIRRPQPVLFTTSTPTLLRSSAPTAIAYLLTMININDDDGVLRGEYIACGHFFIESSFQS